MAGGAAAFNPTNTTTAAAGGRRPATAAASLGARGGSAYGSFAEIPRAPEPRSAVEQEADFWSAAEATAAELRAETEGGRSRRTQNEQQQQQQQQQQQRPSTADYRSSLLAQQQKQLIDEGRALQRPQSKFRKNRIGL